MQIATTILGAGVGVACVRVGLWNEVVGLECGVLGGLWIGALSGTLQQADRSVAAISAAVLSSFAGLFVMLLGFGILLGLFGLALLVLDNPVTGDAVEMPGSLSELLIAPLVPMVFGALGWAVSRVLGWLGDGKDDWIFGTMGAMGSCLSLLPIGIGALALSLALEHWAGVEMAPRLLMAYAFLVGGLHGWFAPKAVTFSTGG